MEYSAVIHPLPDPRKNPGTESSTDAAHNTRVFPTSISAEPSAVSKYPVVTLTGRISAASLLSILMSRYFPEFKNS
jgi:hypothetical protein